MSDVTYFADACRVVPFTSIKYICKSNHNNLDIYLIGTENRSVTLYYQERNDLLRNITQYKRWLIQQNKKNDINL